MLITIGAFDGFHKGHSKLLQTCRDNSKNWSVISFYPHPSEFMHKLDAPLFTLREREFIRRALKIPAVHFIEFNKNLMNLSPSEFWNALKNKFNITGLVVGSDFHFGRNRTGNADYLKKLAVSDGMPENNIFIIPLLLEKNHVKYSSSDARKKIISGNVKSAYEILGYTWFLFANVIHGNARGRTLDFPTANLNLDGLTTLPAQGVYCAALVINKKIYCGAVSIGNNPTFGDVQENRIEIFILDFQGDLYDLEIPVFFLDRLRDIKTFDKPESLKNQIALDVAKCKDIFNEMLSNSATKNFIECAFSQENIPDKNFKPEIIKLC